MKPIPYVVPEVPDFGLVSPDLEEIFKSGRFVNGQWIERFELKCESILGVGNVVACSSGSVALTLLLSTLRCKGEVILPSHTFSATLSAVVWNGLTPVLAECDRNGQISLEHVRTLINDKTVAILPVHMYGNPCNLDELWAIGNNCNARVLVDGAHALGGRYKGHRLCSSVAATMFSLGVTKPLPSVEGGVIATADEGIAEQVRRARDNGRMKGSIDMTCLGLTGRWNEINACIGCHMLDRLDDIIKHRNLVASKMVHELTMPLAGLSSRFVLPENPGDVSTFKDLAIVCTDNAMREKLKAHLTASQIGWQTYFDPALHQTVWWTRHQGWDKMPETESYASRVIQIPCHTKMTAEDTDYVIERIQAFVKDY